MGLSTYLPLIDSLGSEIDNTNQETPIFLAHGTLDPVVPIQLAVNTQTVLNKFGCATEFKKYEMEHSVCPKEIEDISNWINTIFN